MNVYIALSKQESDRITAFLTQLSCYGHTVELVFKKADLLDAEQPVTLDNLPVAKNHLSLLDRVVFEDGKQKTVLYERAVNKDGIRRKQHD